jgi:hypothetical protein
VTAEAFKTLRDRDAWAVIRGFVFQVTQTVLQWIQLGPQDALELERGEDIDLCCNALSAGPEAQQARVLEQLKHRDGRVTLRTSAVAEFLANVLEAWQRGGVNDFRDGALASAPIEPESDMNLHVIVRFHDVFGGDKADDTSK